MYKKMSTCFMDAPLSIHEIVMAEKNEFLLLGAMSFLKGSKSEVSAQQFKIAIDKMNTK